MHVASSNSKKYLIISVLLVAWMLYFAYKPQFWPFITSDGYGYHVWVGHLLSGDLSFCGEISSPKKYSHTFSALNVNSGVCSNMYPPGVGITKLPIALFGPINMSSDADPTMYEQYMSLVFALILLSITAWLCLKLSESIGASPAAAQYSVATFIFGSGLFHYSSFMSSFSHIYSAFWSVVALYSLISEKRLSIIFGFVAGALLILTRATNIIFFPVLVGFFVLTLLRRKNAPRSITGIFGSFSFYRRILPFCTGGVLGVLLQVSLNSYSFGKLTFSSYAGSGAFTFGSEQAFNILRVLFSSGNGVVTFQPIFVVGILALLVIRTTRYFGVLAAMGFIFYLGVYAAWVDWHLGSSFAHRGFIELAPVIGIAFALALTSVPAVHRLTVVIATLAAVTLTTTLMLSNWSFSLPIIDADLDQFIQAAKGSYLRTDQWVMLLGSVLAWSLCARGMFTRQLNQSAAGVEGTSNSGANLRA